MLIADDDELMRSLMSAALIENGFETIEVENGQEAISAVSRIAPDLVLLDVDMPIMDGYAACEHLRASVAGQDIPIIIVTGNEDTESIDRAFRSGATDFISKPVNWSLIGHRVRYVLRGAQTRLALVESEAKNRAMLEALPDRLVLVSAAGQILAVIEPQQNRSLTSINQKSAPQTGQSLEGFLPAHAAKLAREHISRALDGSTDTGFEYSITSERTEPNEHGYFEARIIPQSDQVALLILRDITTRRQTEAQIHKLAYYDGLTGLPNRNYFMLRSAEALNSAAARRDRYLLCYFNLDHFKRINDTLGHAAGDRTLVEVAGRLIEFRNRLRSQGNYCDVARAGSDEFMLLAALRQDQDVSAVVQSLRSDFSAPVACDRHQLVLTISVGSAVFPEDGAEVEALLMHADKAMSSAKQGGRNTHIAYSHNLHERSDDILALESELREAIDRNELTLFFQPKFDLRTNTIVGAEALLRWIHREHGMVSPAVFIPLAEETGLIVDIDRWVVDRACFHLNQWLEKGLNTVPVSINLSGREFCFDQPEITLQRAMQTHGIEPSLLEVEITETVLMADPSAATRTLAKLKAMGIRLAVDDFGTGYSSLGYLKHFPLDVLKIDRSFVSDLEQDENDRALCRAMISMARSLGLEVVAEGIETENQRQFLRYEGCQVGQGFLMSKPISAEAFEDLLAMRAIPVDPGRLADPASYQTRLN